MALADFRSLDAKKSSWDDCGPKKNVLPPKKTVIKNGLTTRSISSVVMMSASPSKQDTTSLGIRALKDEEPDSTGVVDVRAAEDQIWNNAKVNAQSFFFKPSSIA